MSQHTPRRTTAKKAPASPAAASISDDALLVAPLVLVHGKEDLLAERAIDRIVSLARSADPGTQRRTISADSDSAAQEVTDALAPTLFDDSVVVVIAAADCADDRVLNVVSAAVEQPAEGRRIVVWHPGGLKGKSVVDKLRTLGAVVLVCDPIKPYALPDFVTSEFAAHGRTATEAAVAGMISAIGEDARGLAAAVGQLVSDVIEDPIDERAILAYYDGVADVKGWDVSDALWSAQTEHVLTALRQAEQVRPGSGPAYTAALGTGLRNLVRYAGAPRGASEFDIAREMGIPPFKVRIVRTQLARWNPKQLAKAVRRLAEADHQVKGRTETGEGVEPALQEYALERAVVSILGSRGHE